MKSAYVSLVLVCSEMPPLPDLVGVDASLAATTRSHEIIVVVPHDSAQTPLSDVALHGPVTVLTTYVNAERDDALICGLSRAVGDLILEWRGPLAGIDAENLRDLLAPSDAGIEVVEVVGSQQSLGERLLLAMVNSLRTRSTPVRKTVGRVFSRRAIQSVLASTPVERQLDVLVAELPLSRVTKFTSCRDNRDATLFQRLVSDVTLLSKGTRIGSLVPLLLAGISAGFGVIVVVYATSFLVLTGETPEGWTTLMVVIGFGQAATFLMLGLLWTRLEGLSRGLVRNGDATASVAVVAAALEHPTRHES